MVNDIAPVSGVKYGTNAIARNMLVDEHLHDHHTHILWLDVDLVTVPADLIEQLLEVSDADVVAPLIYVEKLHAYLSPSMRNGGWFYDTGGFIQNGRMTAMFGAEFEGGDIIELDSVGSCYVIPADVYRAGLRYSAEGTTVEHVALMAAARELGYRVIARRDTVIEHAFLPKYGVAWK